MAVNQSVTVDGKKSTSEVNLGDPDFWLQEDFHEKLAELREASPISWHQHSEAGAGFWSLLDYEDIAAASSNWQSFSSKYGAKVYHDPGSRLRTGTGALIELDPPEHTANRRRVNPGFMPRQVRKLEGLLEEKVQQILHRFSDGDEIDFLKEVAQVLPVEMVSDLLGVSQKDRSWLVELANVGRAEHDPELASSPEAVESAILDLRRYGVELAAYKRAHPEDDLMSIIANSRGDDGEYLSDEEVAGYFAQMISAGSGTTKAAIAHGMLAFSRFPEQRRIFLEDPVGWATTMPDEVVRWASPIKHMSRVVQRDTELRGVQMKVGDKVAYWYISVNRDPRLFQDPFTFDVTRDPNPHMSFGGGGPHFCMGSALARREIWILFQQLLSRFPESEVISTPVPERSLQSNGLKNVIVRLSK
ncbi:cytochrome P450 [Arthrobacter ginsengisoli]|uniref:Cytochrome P450 n=1 Tax=Arthrobacter ginsengisoli TaxID=1356565 RepID=A0ABU1UDJ7_9MICC|nr:cytochrome P450 [Arthrobacter ginsengisoli]MDR7083278.1 cytochrome P450 [Arthrobacter ginsengisoli]